MKQQTAVQQAIVDLAPCDVSVWHRSSKAILHVAVVLSNCIVEEYIFTTNTVMDSIALSGNNRGSLTSHNQSDETHRSANALPPADSGKQAWLFLAACVMVEVLVWGQYTH